VVSGVTSVVGTKVDGVYADGRTFRVVGAPAGEGRVALALLAA
jgi:hypothetical protein